MPRRCAPQPAAREQLVASAAGPTAARLLRALSETAWPRGAASPCRQRHHCCCCWHHRQAYGLSRVAIQITSYGKAALGLS